MIIELPKKFSYADKKTGEICARVDNSILYINEGIDIEKIMYSLIYSMNETVECYYCKKIITKEKITIDHVYPKSFGGVDITNNFKFACSKCNSEKSDFNNEEYAIYKSLPKKQRKKFRKTTIRQKEQIRKTVGYDLPEKWVLMKNVFDINVFEPYRMLGKSYNKVQNQYEQYGTFIKPIVTDRELNLIDGYNTYRYAVKNHITMVPVIICENVKIVKRKKEELNQ